MHIFEVGIMSDKQRVEAPNKYAAALFYGLHTRGNMQFGVAVYSCDGAATDPDFPFGEWMLGEGDGERLNRLLQNEAAPEIMRECKFVEDV